MLMGGGGMLIGGGGMFIGGGGMFIGGGGIFIGGGGMNIEGGPCAGIDSSVLITCLIISTGAGSGGGIIISRRSIVSTC